jgi:hypothetical protein
MMWASALNLITFIPVSACPFVMLLGLFTLRSPIQPYLPAEGRVAESRPPSRCSAPDRLVRRAATRFRGLRKIRRHALMLYLICKGRRATPR